MARGIILILNSQVMRGFNPYFLNFTFKKFSYELLEINVKFEIRNG